MPVGRNVYRSLGGDDFVFNMVAQFIRIQMRDPDHLGKKLLNGAENVKKAAWITAQSMAPQVESYAKMNAPWTDRTGAARQGLAAQAYREGDEIGIIVYHQVPYGIWLETRWNGAFAIINPTIEKMGPIVMSRFNRLLERI